MELRAGASADREAMQATDRRLARERQLYRVGSDAMRAVLNGDETKRSPNPGVWVNRLTLAVTLAAAVSVNRIAL